MIIEHIFRVTGGSELGQYMKLLEHLRYSHSILLQYCYDKNKNILEALCRWQGTKHGFESAVKRAKSFSNIQIEVIRSGKR